MTDDEYEEIASRAVERFGMQDRIEKLEEEALELTFALNRYRLGKGSMQEVYAEMADVNNVTAQLCKDEQFQDNFFGEIQFKQRRLGRLLDDLEGIEKLGEEALNER